MKMRPDLHLSLSVLGSVQVTLDGQLIARIANKVRALLLILVIERETAHRRETLAEMLWPERDGGAGTASLRNGLSESRQAIHDENATPPFLVINREKLQINRDSRITVDT